MMKFFKGAKEERLRYINLKKIDAADGLTLVNKILSHERFIVFLTYFSRWIQICNQNFSIANSFIPILFSISIILSIPCKSWSYLTLWHTQAPVRRSEPPMSCFQF
jgi:hypothetical protein